MSHFGRDPGGARTKVAPAKDQPRTRAKGQSQGVLRHKIAARNVPWETLIRLYLEYLEEANFAFHGSPLPSLTRSRCAGAGQTTPGAISLAPPDQEKAGLVTENLILFFVVKIAGLIDSLYCSSESGVCTNWPRPGQPQAWALAQWRCTRPILVKRWA